MSYTRRGKQLHDVILYMHNIKSMMFSTKTMKKLTQEMAKPSSSSPPKPSQSVVSPKAEISDDISPGIRRRIMQVNDGAIASISEAVSIACARTAVSEENKELFLGELSVSYLSAAHENAEVTDDAKVVRKGRNVTVVAVDFRLKETRKLIYQSRATLYNMPVPKLRSSVDRHGQICEPRFFSWVCEKKK